MNQREQDNLNARLRARSMNLPRMVRCDHCSMPYYQTSAPHVCAGRATKGNRTMNESEKFIATGVFSHERADRELPLVSKNHSERECSEADCPCHEWVQRFNEHEPVARGGEGERWRVAQRYDGLVLIVRDDADNQETPLLTLGKSDDDYVMANRIVDEHNQHHSLLTERERLRAAIEVAIHNLNAGNDPRFLADYLRLTLDQKEGEG